MKALMKALLKALCRGGGTEIAWTLRDAFALHDKCPRQMSSIRLAYASASLYLF